MNEKAVRASIELFKSHPKFPNVTATEAAQYFGVPVKTFRTHINQHAPLLGFDLHRTYSVKQAKISVPPDDELSVEEIIAHKKRLFKQKRSHEEGSKLIKVVVDDHLPIGILHFGDPHIDDDGCDIEAIERHMELTRTVPGLYGANCGDTTNNWIGRLARLYAHQSTTSSQAWKLAQWFIENTRWLYLIGGNHDQWSGDGDPLKWICAQQNAVYQGSEVRMGLNFPSGSQVRINARHDFIGHSQFNTAHGPLKSQIFGTRDHIAIAGHQHVSGYNVHKDPESGVTLHAIRVASYKVYDRYAIQKGYRDQRISPCAMTIINHHLPPTHPDLIKLYWDAEEGSRALTYLRDRLEGEASLSGNPQKRRVQPRQPQAEDRTSRKRT